MPETLLSALYKLLPLIITTAWWVTFVIPIDKCEEQISEKSGA